MIRKIKFILLQVIITFSLCACSLPFQTYEGNEQSDQNMQVKSDITIEQEKPDLSQIRSICDLATLECYYHNVAKSTVEKGQGLFHLGEKKRTFWIEYTGTAKIGIDMSEVKMTVDDTNVIITIPEAKLIDYKVDDIKKDNYISSDDSRFNKNPITAEQETDAVNKAQEEMKASVEGNTSLSIRAQERAKSLIENYVTRLGEAVGIKYRITWKYNEKNNILSSNDIK